MRLDRTILRLAIAGCVLSAVPAVAQQQFSEAERLDDSIEKRKTNLESFRALAEKRKEERDKALAAEKAETARKKAETARKTTEAARKTTEAARLEAKLARLEAELAQKIQKTEDATQLRDGLRAILEGSGTPDD